MVVNPINPTNQPVIQLTEYDRSFFKTIKELAIRILFPLAVMWMMGSVLPISFSAVVLTGSVIAATLLSSFFFQSDTLICPPPPEEPVSFLTPAGSNLQLAALNDATAPNGYPRGIINGYNNCGINSVAQSIRITPRLNHWIRNLDVTPELDNFRHFYQAYDQSDGRRVVGASSQFLRLSLSQINNIISPDITRQIDAADALMVACNFLPVEMQGEIQETKFWDTSQFGPIRDNPGASNTYAPNPFFSLQLSLPPNGPARFSDILQQQFYDTDVSREADQGVRREGMDGAIHRYPLLRTERSILRAPQVLVVNIKRYRERPPTFLESLWSKDPVLEEIGTSVEIGDEIQIPTSQGLSRYRLKGFITHMGNPRAGHYTATGEENGVRYHYDDSTVTPITSGEDWERKKSRANVLVFELV